MEFEQLKGLAHETCTGRCRRRQAGVVDQLRELSGENSHRCPLVIGPRDTHRGATRVAAGIDDLTELIEADAYSQRQSATRAHLPRRMRHGAHRIAESLKQSVGKQRVLQEHQSGVAQVPKILLNA